MKIHKELFNTGKAYLPLSPIQLFGFFFNRVSDVTAVCSLPKIWTFRTHWTLSVVLACVTNWIVANLHPCSCFVEKLQWIWPWLNKKVFLQSISDCPTSRFTCINHFWWLSVKLIIAFWHLLSHCWHICN